MSWAIPGDADALLAHATLREDAGFHAYQMLEAGVRQFTAWGDTDVGRHILVAVARLSCGPFAVPNARRCRRLRENWAGEKLRDGVSTARNGVLAPALDWLVLAV